MPRSSLLGKGLTTNWTILPRLVSLLHKFSHSPPKTTQLISASRVNSGRSRPATPLIFCWSGRILSILSARYGDQLSLCSPGTSLSAALDPFFRRFPMEIQKFVINIPDATLTDLKRRLDATRWPDEIENVGWESGASLGYMKSLIDYWRNGYDWRRQE